MIQMQEGWVKFQRYPCKEGYIDRWVGDMADDPNNDTRSYIHLNGITEYFRLNGEEIWISVRLMGRDNPYMITTLAPEYPATEIWQLLMEEL